MSGNPSGRPKGESLDNVLRQHTDLHKLVLKLLGIAHKDGHRDQMRAIEYAMNRLAGAPRQMLTLEADADSPAVLLMRQIWSRLGSVEDSVSQSPAVDAEVRELPAGQAPASVDASTSEQEGAQLSQDPSPVSC